MEWLRDPIWQFIGAFIGIMAIGLTYFVFRRQQKVKSVVYEIISNTPLLSVKSEIKNKMQISYSGRTILNLNLLVLRIQNLGNETVLPADYERPITIEFDGNTEILEVEGIDVSPKDLQPRMEKDKSKISLLPILLNPKDFITMKILLAEFNGKTTVSGRIAGVKQVLGVGIDRLSSTHSFLGDLVSLSAFSMVILPFLVASGFLIRIGEYIWGALAFAAFLFYLWLAVDIIRDTNNRTKDLLRN